VIGVEETLNVGKKQFFFAQKIVRLGSNRGHTREKATKNAVAFFIYEPKAGSSPVGLQTMK
jgi:hypothetical protein